MGFDDVLYGMSYANFLLYSAVIPNPPRYDKQESKGERKQSGLTFSQLLSSLKQMPSQ